MQPPRHDRLPFVRHNSQSLPQIHSSQKHKADRLPHKSRRYSSSDPSRLKFRQVRRKAASPVKGRTQTAILFSSFAQYAFAVSYKHLTLPTIILV